MAGMGAGFVAFSTLPFLIDDKGDPRGPVIRVLVSLVGFFGLWALWRTVALFRTKQLSVVVTSRYLEMPVVSGRPAVRAPLEDVERVMRQSTNGARQAIVFEISDGRKLTIGALMLPPGLETEICSLVMDRAALRKAGVDTRKELAAAEAYLDAARTSARPFGVQVSKAKSAGKREVVVLRTRDDVDSDTKDAIVYVPAAVFAVLDQSGAATDNMKPLRGVDRT
jgi:hypothetical protein